MQWWDDNNRDIRVIMHDILCPECRKGYEGVGTAEGEIDWVDEATGEVARVDGLWHALRMCCSVKPGYITPNTPIVEAVFRTFLANGNKPLTIQELYERLDRRPPQTLLRMLTAGQVYLGLRPVME
jgi:hypothetical protein